jgi:hypothetical protein
MTRIGLGSASFARLAVHKLRFLVTKGSRTKSSPQHASRTFAWCFLRYKAVTSIERDRQSLRLIAMFPAAVRSSLLQQVLGQASGA